MRRGQGGSSLWLLDYQIHLPLLELSKNEALKLLDLQTKSTIDSDNLQV
jgi:hypothetical protein